MGIELLVSEYIEQIQFMLILKSLEIGFEVRAIEIIHVLPLDYPGPGRAFESFIDYVAHLQRHVLIDMQDWAIEVLERLPLPLPKILT